MTNKFNKPGDAYVLIKRADARFYMQRHDEAEVDYQKAFELEPNYGGYIYYKLGWIAEMRKDYEEAQGDTHCNQNVRLSSIRIGELEVTGVKAGIVPNQKAPLLLGQSVLERFGRVEIDTHNSILRITVLR